LPRPHGHAFRPGDTGGGHVSVPVPARVARKPILRDLVEIRLVVAADVIAHDEAARLVEGSGKDRDAVFAILLPEKRRAASGSEATPGIGARPVSCQHRLADHPDIVQPGIRGGIVEAGLASALGAMAGDHLPQRPTRLKPYRAAEASA